MKKEEKRLLIESYLSAYNTFDIDGMMEVIHADIEFENIYDGKVNATASGTVEFRKLAQQSNHLFTSRSQAAINFEAFDDDRAAIDVSFEAVLASDMPNGMKAGETLRLTGRSEFTFRDRKIYRIKDFS